MSMRPKRAEHWCNCEVDIDPKDGLFIRYCPTHGAAMEMLSLFKITVSVLDDIPALDINPLSKDICTMIERIKQESTP